MISGSPYTFEQVERNEQEEKKSPSKSASSDRLIVIEGGIGVGKTSLTRMLANRWQADSYFEEFEDNPFLTGGFYKNTDLLAFNTEMFFLISRYRQQKALSQKKGLLVSDYLFEKNWIFAQMNLKEEDLETYQKVYESFLPQVRKPDLIVFLKADLETLLRRIYFRDREFERSLSPTYLERLIHEYYRFFSTYKEVPILTVEAGNLDFVNDSKDFDRTCTAIEDRLSGQIQLSLEQRRYV